MSKISCLLRISQVPLHLYQITAGFILLSRQGVIDLKIEKLRRNDIKLPYNMLEVVVNNHIRILYDANDGYDNLLGKEQGYVEFYDDLLDRYNLCFKRSFSKYNNERLKHKSKIFPLGLNYMTSINGNIAHNLMPQEPLKEKVKKLIRKLPLTEHYNGFYDINSFENLPSVMENPQILFMARLWDVNGDQQVQLSSEKREERNFINNFRAECIRLCRRTFGDKFYGGVSPTKYAVDNYQDIVIEDKRITKRNNYLQKVKESDICIATMGLHKSIGWKFAEYIAASKAILTEGLNYELPGNICEGCNFYVFNTPEDCIEKINLLLNDKGLRYKMMLNNFRYYHEFIRPDRLILNSLLIVLQTGTDEQITGREMVG